MEKLTKTSIYDLEHTSFFLDDSEPISLETFLGDELKPVIQNFSEKGVELGKILKRWTTETKTVYY